MQEGYRRIFWGLILSFFHINIGSLQLLPPFIGWLIIASGVNILYNEHNSSYFHKSYLFAVISAIVSLAGDMVNWVGVKNEFFVYVPIIFAIVELFFIYYLLEGSIEFLYEIKENDTAKAYEDKLRAYLIVFIINTILECIGFTIYNFGLSLVIMAITFIMVIWLMFIVNSLKKIEYR